MDKTGKIDDIDRNILSILMENSNTSYAVIAKKLFVSSGTVHVRMTKLKEMGIVTGANLTMRGGSGRPYTKTSRANGAQVFAGNGRAPQEGQLNSSRLPFSTTFDFKIDRNFDVKFGKKNEDGNKKEASLNVYIQILNLLDARNILGVYSFTGNASDDGFLAASYNQTFIEQQLDEESFRDLYSAKEANGANYALPRRIRLGIQLNF